MSLDLAYRKLSGARWQVVRRPAAGRGRDLLRGGQHERRLLRERVLQAAQARTCSPSPSRGRRSPASTSPDVLQPDVRGRDHGGQEDQLSRGRRHRSSQGEQLPDRQAGAGERGERRRRDGARRAGRRRDRAGVLLPPGRRRLQLRRGPVLLRPVLRALPRLRPADPRDPRQPRRHGLRRRARPAPRPDLDRVPAQLLRRGTRLVPRCGQRSCARP